MADRIVHHHHYDPFFEDPCVPIVAGVIAELFDPETSVTSPNHHRDAAILLRGMRHAGLRVTRLGTRRATLGCRRPQ